MSLVADGQWFESLQLVEDEVKISSWDHGKVFTFETFVTVTELIKANAGSRFHFVRAKVVAPNFVKCPHRKRNLKTSAPSNLFKVSHLASPHSSTAFDRTCFFSWADIFGFGKPQKYSDPYRLRWYRKDRGTSSTMLKCVICSNKEVLAVSRTPGLKDIV